MYYNLPIFIATLAGISGEQAVIKVPSKLLTVPTYSLDNIQSNNATAKHVIISAITTITDNTYKASGEGGSQATTGYIPSKDLAFRKMTVEELRTVKPNDLDTLARSIQSKVVPQLTATEKRRRRNVALIGTPEIGPAERGGTGSLLASNQQDEAIAVARTKAENRKLADEVDYRSFVHVSFLDKLLGYSIICILLIIGVSFILRQRIIRRNRKAFKALEQEITSARARKSASFSKDSNTLESASSSEQPDRRDPV